MLSLAQVIKDVKDNIENILNIMAPKAYVDKKVADIVNGAPEQLDTLQELSKALNNDKDFGATVNNAIAKKLDLAGGTITGDLAVNGSLTAKASTAGTADRALKADACTGNAATASSVAWSGITNKPTSFTPSSHTHAWGQITGAPVTATRWPSWSEVTEKPSTFTPSSHNHDSAYPSTTGTRASGTWGINITGAAEKIKTSDTRNINKNPQQCMADSGYALNADFKSKGTVGIGGTGTYAGLLTFAPWGGCKRWLSNTNCLRPRQRQNVLQMGNICYCLERMEDGRIYG